MNGQSDNGLTADGIEGSCAGAGRDRFRLTPGDAEVWKLEAHLAGLFYRPHRHDSYAIGITMAGVQRYTYRRAGRVSLPGEVVVLYPDELHDGEAGTPEGLSYRMLYVSPVLIRDALEGEARHLPFVAAGHSTDARLAAAVAAALRDLDRPFDGIERDQAVLGIADALLALDRGAQAHPGRGRPGVAVGIRRVREALEAAAPGTVSSAMLEAAAGLSRFELARQFRRAYGVSPYRFLTLRRLDLARRLLATTADGLADIALAAGFADQAHFTRQFAGAYGLPPGRWRALTAAA